MASLGNDVGAKGVYDSNGTWGVVPGNYVQDSSGKWVDPAKLSPTTSAATAAETEATPTNPATMYSPTTLQRDTINNAVTAGSTSKTTAAKSTPLTYTPVTYTPLNYEQVKYTPQTYTPTGMYDTANLEAYNKQREDQIRQMYADAQKSTLAGLKTAYDQNLSDANAYRDQISPQYQQSMSALGAEYERQRRNNNMQAAANGLNSGAGSQMALAQSANYQANQAGLAAKENQALDEANRRINDLKMNYQNAIAEATAQNNYKLAASLLDEYQNAYNRQLQIENANYERAQQIDNQNYERARYADSTNYQRALQDYQLQQQIENLNYQRQQQVEQQNYTRQFNEEERDYSRGLNEAQAKSQYGDFSGYADIYGDEIAKAMELTWALQNPYVAYAAGKLSAEDFTTLTGQTPAGAAAASSGSSSSSGSKTVKSSSGSRSGGSGGSGYFGPPGYLNTDGQFVVPGASNYGNYSNTTAASGHEGDKARADAYAQTYSAATSSGYGTGSATVAATKAGQTAAKSYEEAARSR